MHKKQQVKLTIVNMLEDLFHKRLTFPSRGFPPSENECLQTIRDILCFMPPHEPPHLYKFFQFSKCHLTPMSIVILPDAKDQIHVLTLIVLLESYLLRIRNLCLLNTPKKFFIFPEASVTTKIMCYLCSRMSPLLEG